MCVCVCVLICFLRVCCCLGGYCYFYFYFLFLFFITPPLGQPRAVFGGVTSNSGGRMLLCKEAVVAEDSPRITVKRVTF